MLDVIAPLVVSNTTKIVLVSLDGLGGLPRPETGRSELETARLPNLSQLAVRDLFAKLEAIELGKQCFRQHQVGL